MMPKTTDGQTALIDLMALVVPRNQRSEWRKLVTSMTVTA